MQELIPTLSDYLSIIGFLITVVTLVMMINIRGKLSKTLDKQQFLKDRNEILKNLAGIYDTVQVNEVAKWAVPQNSGCFDDFINALLEIQRDTAQLENYKFWSSDARRKIGDFSEVLSDYIHLIDDCSRPEPNGKKPKKYNDRARVELLEWLNRIIALLKKESTVL